MTNTNAAKIRIVTVSSPKGDTEVHGPGCADLKKKAKGYEDEYPHEVGSLVELSHAFWYDQIGDQVNPDSPEGWAVAESWSGEFRFMPCAPKFPGEAKPAKAKQTRAERIAAAGAAEAARCAASSAPLAVVSLSGEEIEVQVTATASEPHAFSAKGSAKASACASCGRTWNAAAHRAFRAAASA